MLFLIKKLVVFFCLAILFSPFLVYADTQKTFDEYVEFFYDRYSSHLDQCGLVYSAPNYGIKDAKLAETPRELMSLSMYYRYRALNNDTTAQAIIKQAILTANKRLGEIPAIAMSFEDASAQFLMWRMLEDTPVGMSSGEIEAIERRIISRAKDGLLAQDTSNRAALSAAYWQYLVFEASKKGFITAKDVEELNLLIKNKIDQVKKIDINKNGWYVEGIKKQFNPHYHMVTAVAFLFYGEYAGSEEYVDLAKKMTINLRSVTFKNGMVEAMIGERPVGLGAQFYLGAGVLNWKFGFKDYGAYLKYADGNTFFTDPNNSDRLEYHSTRVGEVANYHDDYAFSNLAEMVLKLSQLKNQQILFSDHFQLGLRNAAVVNNGSEIVVNGKKVVQVSDYFSTISNVTSKKLAQVVVKKSVDKKIVAKKLKIDSDKDGLVDEVEVSLGTSPFKKDTDGDGYNDALELKMGYDPLNPRPVKRKIAKK